MEFQCFSWKNRTVPNSRKNDENSEESFLKVSAKLLNVGIIIIDLANASKRGNKRVMSLH